MSPENQWLLEDVFPIEIDYFYPFLGDMFSGFFVCLVGDFCMDWDPMGFITMKNQHLVGIFCDFCPTTNFSKSKKKGSSNRRGSTQFHFGALKKKNIR